jgi:nucleoid-associated protein Lsr2
LPSEGVATVTFSLDGVSYQIDLNEANASKLRDGLADFISAARRTGGRMKRGSAAGGRAASANDGPAIREWAREQGHELAERGRIPSHIVDAFHAANRGGRRVAAKAAAATKTAVAKATATAGSKTRSSGARPAAGGKATKAPATKRTSAAKSSAAAKTTAKPAAKAPAKATAKTPAKAAPKAAAKPARSPRATKSTVTAKTTGQRGRKA